MAVIEWGGVEGHPLAVINPSKTSSCEQAINPLCTKDCGCEITRKSEGTFQKISMITNHEVNLNPYEHEY